MAQLALILGQVMDDSPKAFVEEFSAAEGGSEPAIEMISPPKAEDAENTEEKNTQLFSLVGDLPRDDD
jgi:hypothetical protein